MPRLEPITRPEQVPPGGESAIQAIFGSRGAVNPPQSMLLYSPTLAAGALQLNDALRAAMPEYEYEIVVLTAAREFPVEFVWTAHVTAGRAAGVSDALIEEIRTGRPITAGKRETILVQLGRELVGGLRTLSQTTFDEARAELGEARMIEAIATIGYYLFIGCVLNGVQYEPRDVTPMLNGGR